MTSISPFRPSPYLSTCQELPGPVVEPTCAAGEPAVATGIPGLIMTVMLVTYESTADAISLASADMIASGSAPSTAPASLAFWKALSIADFIAGLPVAMIGMLFSEYPCRLEVDYLALS